MPSLKGHIRRSLRRTGREFRELNEWMDGRTVPYRDRIDRHRISNIAKFSRTVEDMFGKEGLEEYLHHLKDDYNSHWILRIVKRLKGLSVPI